MDTLFFIVSKVARIFLDPANLIFFLFLIGTVAVFLKRLKLSRLMLGSGCLLAALLLLVPVGTPLVTQLENRFPVPKSLPDHVDGIIVLGGVASARLQADRGTVALNGSVERFLAFAELSQRYPSAKTIFTGGSGSLVHQSFKEADVAGPILEKLGMDISQTVFENQSRNTYENAVLSLEYAEISSDETWILITSAAHIPRAVGVFRAVGWPNIVPYPVDFNTISKLSMYSTISLTRAYIGLNAAIGEYVGLLTYFLSGKTDTLLPAP